MNSWLPSSLLAIGVLSFGQVAWAQAPREITTLKNKPVVLSNFLNAPKNCSANPGPVPLPKLHEKPSHGSVALQVVLTSVAAANGCPDRKIPSIALVYTPGTDFVGRDSIQIEFETEPKLAGHGYLVTVQEAAGR